MDCLQHLMQSYRIQSGTHLTNKLRVERLLRHLQYSEEQIQQILALFPKRSKAKVQEEDQSEGEDDTDDPHRCEAQILT